MAPYLWAQCILSSGIKPTSREARISYMIHSNYALNVCGGWAMPTGHGYWLTLILLDTLPHNYWAVANL